MQCPTLHQLPPPPTSLTGWPWTEDTQQLYGTILDGHSLPRISIITPNLNYGSYLEKTIRSILLQGYPNLEYIIIDGGSTDSSLEIIQKYQAWLTYWESFPDRGQSNAINKGIAIASGEVFNWINSDDWLAPGALMEVGSIWAKDRPHLLVGHGYAVEDESNSIRHDWFPKVPKHPLDFLRPGKVVMSQPSTFLSVKSVKELGNLNDSLHFLMDWDLYFRLAVAHRDKLKYTSTPAVLSYFRSHDAAKTGGRYRLEVHQEGRQVLDSLRPKLHLSERIWLAVNSVRKKILDIVKTGA